MGERRKRKNGGSAERGREGGRDREGEHVHEEEQERLRECTLKTKQMPHSDHGKAG